MEAPAAVNVAHLVEVAPLTPYAKNARIHSAAQIEQIKASIRSFGFVGVLAYDKHGLAIGHGRREAALGMWAAGETVMGPGKREALPEGYLPAIDLSGLTDEERRALIISDNKIGLNSGWDEDMLASELAALQDMGFEMPTIGFDPRELENLLSPNRGGVTDPDEIPDVPEKPASVAGDVWILGRHRIICGSSTCAEDVASVLDGEKPHLMVTDPPYGVNYDASWREGSGLNRKGAATGKVLNDDKAEWREAWALFPGDVAYVWHGALHSPEVAASLEAERFEVRSQIIWAKQQLVIGRGDYHWKHEPCWYVVRKGAKGHWAGDRKQTTVWEIDKPHRSETGHSTQKPIECMQKPMENNSVAGDWVYEPFSGSGTTIIAGEITGRRVLAIELNPAYVDVAVRRWEEFTGDAATLRATGQTFAEVSAERLVPAE